MFTVDGGNTSLWAYNMKPPTRPRSYHSILEFGMPGTWIPFAIGAKLGGPTARSSASPATKPRASTSWSCRPARARASTSP